MSEKAIVASVGLDIQLTDEERMQLESLVERRMLAAISRWRRQEEQRIDDEIINGRPDGRSPVGVIRAVATSTR